MRRPPCVHPLTPPLLSTLTCDLGLRRLSPDYRWPWVSFFCAGSTAIYVFLYSIYYFFYKTKSVALGGGDAVARGWALTPRNSVAMVS